MVSRRAISETVIGDSRDLPLLIMKRPRLRLFHVLFSASPFLSQCVRWDSLSNYRVIASRRTESRWKDNMCFNTKCGYSPGSRISGKNMALEAIIKLLKDWTMNISSYHILSRKSILSQSESRKDLFRIVSKGAISLLGWAELDLVMEALPTATSQVWKQCAIILIGSCATVELVLHLWSEVKRTYCPKQSLVTSSQAINIGRHSSIYSRARRTAELRSISSSFQRILVFGVRLCVLYWSSSQPTKSGVWTVRGEYSECHWVLCGEMTPRVRFVSAVCLDGYNKDSKTTQEYLSTFDDLEGTMRKQGRTITNDLANCLVCIFKKIR